MNVIIVILRTSGATYRNSFKVHVFRNSSCIQRVLDHLNKMKYGWFGKQRFAKCCHNWKEAREVYTDCIVVINT